MDLAITLDLAKTFNKEGMYFYLTENFDFFEGEWKEAYNSIVDNNFYVGKDCLIWFYVNSRLNIFYRFVCKITSSDVYKTIGNHITNFVNYPDARLKEEDPHN